MVGTYRQVDKTCVYNIRKFMKTFTILYKKLASWNELPYDTIQVRVYMSIEMQITIKKLTKYKNL